MNRRFLAMHQLQRSRYHSVRSRTHSYLLSCDPHEPTSAMAARYVVAPIVHTLGRCFSHASYQWRPMSDHSARLYARTGPMPQLESHVLGSKLPLQPEASQDGPQSGQPWASLLPCFPEPEDGEARNSIRQSLLRVRLNTVLQMRAMSPRSVSRHDPHTVCDWPANGSNTSQDNPFPAR